MIAHQRAAFAKGIADGVKIVLGTDVGGFSWDVNQAVELKRMVDAGMSTMQTIKASTTVAAELLGMKGRLGEIVPGAYADIIAAEGDPLKDISTLEHVQFVMKDGKIYKNAVAR